MRRNVERFGSLTNPLVLVKLHLLAVGITVLLFVLVTAIFTTRTEHQAQEASRDSDAAQFAASSQSSIDEITDLLIARAERFLDSAEVAGLNVAEQEALTRELRRRDAGSPEPGLPNILIPLSMPEAVEFQARLDREGQRPQPPLEHLPPDLLAKAASLEKQGQSIIQTYIAEPTPTNFRLLVAHFREVTDLLSAQAPIMIAEADLHRNQLADVITDSRTAIFGSAAILGLALLLLGWYMARRVRVTLESVERNQRAVAEVSTSLQYRNEQLNALYNVFAEITESLSLRYVVASTVEQAVKVMGADIVVLRLLRNGELELAGGMTADGRMLEDLPPVTLGEGPTGRVARRGRPVRIPTGAQELLGPVPDPEERVESGIIVPLIVGARVVGTIGCWSKREDAFGDEDERILEMMASQVATAIVAADTTENSERQAMIDPLTNLPNRRQLDRDLVGELRDLAAQGRKAIFAMADIDHFKRLNDEFGHKVGDVTLQKVAAIMRMAVRSDDRVYRYGGEEFLIIFLDNDADEALTLGNRVRTAIESAPMTGDVMQPVGPVTISMGMALLPEDAGEVGMLIQMADKAMYNAKQSGRNRVKLWSETLEADPQPDGMNGTRAILEVRKPAI